MRTSVLMLVLMGCGGGSGDGAFADLIPRVAWSEVEVVQLGDAENVQTRIAVTEVERVLRTLSDQAIVRTTPHRRVDILADGGGVTAAARYARHLEVPARQANASMRGLTCQWMMQDLELTETIARMAPSDSIGSDEDRARLLCETPLRQPQVRLYEHRCSGSSTNAAHGLLFPLPELRVDSFDDQTRVSFDADTRLPMAVSDGVVWAWDLTGAGRVHQLDMDTGAALGSVELPPGVDVERQLLVGPGVQVAITMGGLLRRVGEGAWQPLSQVGEVLLVGLDAVWGRDVEGLWRLPHDSDQAERVPLPGVGVVRLELHDGEVWVEDGQRPRRWTGSDWEVDSRALSRWHFGGVYTRPAHDDGWGMLNINGVVVRLEGNDRVTADGDICTPGTVQRQFGDGQDLLAVEQDTWFRVPAP